MRAGGAWTEGAWRSWRPPRASTGWSGEAANRSETIRNEARSFRGRRSGLAGGRRFVQAREPLDRIGAAGPHVEHAAVLGLRLGRAPQPLDDARAAVVEVGRLREALQPALARA